MQYECHILQVDSYSQLVTVMEKNNTYLLIK